MSSSLANQSNSLIKLTRLLLDRTVEGKLTWEATPHKSVFVAGLPDGAVRVKQPSEGLGLGLPVDSDIVLEVLNTEGSVIAELRTSGFGDRNHLEADTLRELYETVRRQVLRVDETIEDLINFLK
jgi:hypothetical protein